MKLYEIVIKPITGFGTPLKGDTLFGHFCWQAAYDATLLNRGLEKWISLYQGKPFAVFSSAWPRFFDAHARYALKRPDLPLSMIFGRKTATDRKAHVRERKELARKRWLLVSEDLRLAVDPARHATDEELVAMASASTQSDRLSLMASEEGPFFSHIPQPHNTINRLTMTTGEGMFAPFEEPAQVYFPGLELAVFTLLDSSATDIERVASAIERIGRWGYGKNASTGLGRYKLSGYREIKTPEAASANACYALSPSVPERAGFSECYFTPFVRFGKHGDRLARSGNPFKNPVIMADEGAVFLSDKQEVFRKPYLGSAVMNVSKSMPQSVAQGYSIYLPFMLEM